MDEGTSLWLPPLALAGCVRAVMLRDTRCRGLRDAALDSFLPATPLLTLYLFSAGDGEWVASPGFSTPEEPQPRGRLRLAGPFTQPTRTRAQGEVAVFTVLWLADAFAALTGIEAAALCNRVVDPLPLLPAAWRDWLAQLQAAPDDAARLAALLAFLQPRWAALARQRPGRQRYGDWAESLALRAASSAAGRSLRQVERRVKAWAGLPMRELRAVSRAEAAFLQRAAQADASWAEIAAEAGYSDQSHLCRETRRLTGFSPEVLRQRIETDEAFWAYRLWR